MILAPIVLYFVAYAIDIHYFHPRGQTRPLAFWAPALIVAAMPTANNMHLGRLGRLGRLGPVLESSEMRLVYMGVSENSVPLNPMVLLIIIPIFYGYNWEYTLFSDKPIWRY